MSVREKTVDLIISAVISCAPIPLDQGEEREERRRR